MTEPRLTLAGNGEALVLQWSGWRGVVDEPREPRVNDGSHQDVEWRHSRSVGWVSGPLQVDVRKSIRSEISRLKSKFRIMNSQEGRYMVRTRASPGSDASRHPPVDTNSMQGVLRKPQPKPKKIVESFRKIGSWNVGSMTGRGRELVEVFERRPIGIACVQETKWTGKSARELGDGYKIFYGGERRKQNGVGVILDADLKSKVIDIKRPGDRLIKVKLVEAGEVYNIISAYAPQAGCSIEDK